MAYPRFQLARAHKTFKRTAGNLTTFTSTSWADLPTIGTTWDAALPAQVGDTLECGMSGMWASGNQDSCLDIATIVGGSPVNYFMGGGGAASYGNPGWSLFAGSGGDTIAPISGAITYVLVAGDIEDNTVTVRVRYRVVASSTSVIRATADQPFHFWAKNIGPVDPN